MPQMLLRKSDSKFKVIFDPLLHNRLPLSDAATCITYERPGKEYWNWITVVQSNKPEDHWSCIAHLSVEDMLKSAVIGEK